MKVVLNDLQPAKPPARDQEREDPGGPTRDVVRREPGIRHLADPRDEWGKGPDDWHKPREDDRQAAVLLVERMRSHEVLFIQEPGVLAGKDARTDVMTNAVI